MKLVTIERVINSLDSSGKSLRNIDPRGTEMGEERLGSIRQRLREQQRELLKALDK